MDKDEIVAFLDEKLAKIKKDEPHAFSIINSYEAVINDVMSEN